MSNYYTCICIIPEEILFIVGITPKKNFSTLTCYCSCIYDCVVGHLVGTLYDPF